MNTGKALVRKVRLSDITKAAYNPRTISDAARKGLRESLTLFGMLDMPVLNVHDGALRLVGGHQRFDALIADGYTHADCVLVDYDEETERLANVALNNPAIQGTFDTKLALPVLDGLKIPEADIAGFAELQRDLRQKAERAGGRWEQHKALDEERGETGEVIDSKEGVTYKLGKHRLFCGPCADGIPALLGKKQAVCCITDPPYNVAYSEEIENDDMPSEEWDLFVQMFCDLILKRTDGPCYVFMGSAELPMLEEKWLACGGVVQRWLWWVKDRFTLGRSDYRHQHEPILYGWRKGLAPAPPREARTNALQFPRPRSSPLHPTMKPVDLVRTLMRDATEVGDLVIEPFAGSGTTLVVAEELDRVCYATELSPKHCDTIRMRWATQTSGDGCDWRSLTPEA